MGSANPERVLVHAPYGRDGELIARELNQGGIDCERCATVEAICSELSHEVGALIIADEALRAANVAELGCILNRQESWSDLPVLVLTGSGEATEKSRYRLKLLEPLGNITLLERPLRSETAISAVLTALRARRRQYQIRDLISTEQRAVNALRESEDHFRNAVELNPQVPWTAASDGTLQDFSPRWLELTGLRREEALRTGWTYVVHPDDRSWGANSWRDCVKTGEPYDVEQRIQLADGTYRWMRTRARPRRNNDTGEIVRWYGTTEDIHERKIAEQRLREANAELVTTNRELEEFVFAASHDLQEPLRMVNIYTQLLMRKFGDTLDAEASSHAEVVHKAVQRMENLLRDLLSFSRATHTEPELEKGVRLSQVLSDALSSLQQRIEETQARIIYNELPEALVQARLSQVFQNLISNSLKYRKINERPHIVISSQPKDSDWIMTVKDNGIGFDQKYADRIFGLFRRLHTAEYPGTGIGLAICKRIIERHGGRIWAESAPDQGATFYFTVPRTRTA